MAVLVQKSAGGITALKAGNEFYNTVASGKIMATEARVQNIYSVGSAIYINFTPSVAQNFLGVILNLYNTQGDGSTQRQRVITVELEENSGGWTNRLTQTIDTNNLIPDNTWSRSHGLFDVRFGSTYTLDTNPVWRLKIYHDGTGSGTFYVTQSESGGDDDVFHIVYSDTTVTFTDSDTLVLTDRITIDDDLTIAAVDARSGSQNGDHAKSNFYSVFGCIPNANTGTNPQLYVPSAVAADYTLTLKGCLYASSYSIALLVGEDADNPIPGGRIFTVDFDTQSSVQEAGFLSGGLSSYYGKLSGIQLYGTIPTTMWTTLNDDAAASQAEVKVDGDVTSDWAINDYLEIGGAQQNAVSSNNDFRYQEYRQIQGMTFAAGVTTITLTVNLSYNHYVEAGLSVYVANTTRNVVVKGADATWTNESWSELNGGYYKAQGVRFEHLQYLAIRNNLSSDRSASQAIASRTYIDSCHFHDCGYPARFQSDKVGSTVIACSWSSSVTGSTVSHYGPYITGSNRNVTIDGCVMHSRLSRGVFVSAGFGATVQNCFITAQYGVWLEVSTGSAVINNTEFLRCLGGVYATGCQSLTGDGNTFRKCYQTSTAGAAAANIAGCYIFNKTNGIVTTVRDDADDSHAFALIVQDAGVDASFKDATLGNTWNDDVVGEANPTYRNAWNPGAELKFQNYDNIANDHRAWFTDGYWQSTGTGLGDTEGRTTGAGMIAWRSEPHKTNEEIALEMTTPISVANEVITITVYCYIAEDAYDAGVNVAPTLTVSGADVTTTTDTADVTADGSWQLLSVSVTPTDVGELNIKLSSETDASGSNAYVYWDDMFVSYKSALDLGTLDFVSRGMPISPPLTTGIQARSVWAELLANSTVSASMGEAMNRINNLSVTGSAINAPANSYALTTGTESSGAVAVTIPLDGVHHEHTDDGGTTDIYYEFSVGGDGVPTNFIFTGRINGPNDDIDIFGYDWSSSQWVQIGTLEGTALSVNTPYDITMFNTMVGTGVDLGTVRVRFYSTVLTSSTLRIDQCYISYSIVTRSVGYADGMIWVDTNASNTNTESYVDGTADNPVSTWAAALTLNSALGLNSFHIAADSSITLTDDSSAYELVSHGEWNLVLGGQIIAHAYFNGAAVTGTGTGHHATFDHCQLDAGGGNDFTIGEHTHMQHCALGGTVTLSDAGDYFFNDCQSIVAGMNTPVLEFGSGIGSSNVNFRRYSGGIELKNFGANGTDKMSLEGKGQLVFNANCDPSNNPEIAVRGHFRPITDNVSGGFEAGGGTLNVDANYYGNNALDAKFAAINFDDEFEALTGITNHYPNKGSA